MRKLLIAVLVAAALLTVSHVEDAITFDTITGLDLAREKIAAGVTIERVYYTDGFGFSTSEFETADPEEIHCLWEAVQEIVLGERVDQDITDWYPQIIYFNYLSGTLPEFFCYLLRFGRFAATPP